MYRVKVTNVAITEKEAFLKLCASFGEVESFESSKLSGQKVGLLSDTKSVTPSFSDVEALKDVMNVGYVEKEDAEAAQKNLDGMIFCENVLRASLVKA